MSQVTMKNLILRVDGEGKIILEIDGTTDVGVSKSGKSTLVCSSGGRTRFRLPDGTDAFLNCTIDKPRN